MRKILLLGTGGTISCAKTDNGLAPALSVNELLKGIEVRAEIHSEQLFELDSTNMTPRHWEKLAKRIAESYDEFDGFVITHGTDTMGYAAASLSCLIQNSRKPIVFTGSMKPMIMEHSDAPQNLRDAIAFAADDRAFGVRVVFSGYIYDGRNVSKQDTDTLEPFDSINNENYGYWNDGKLVFNEEFSEYTGETRFYERLSDDVFHVKLIPGQKLYVPGGAKAVILESYGDGGIPGYLLENVAELTNAGVYVIVATQVPFGGTHMNLYETGQAAAKRFPLIETGKMTVEYAVARARWALANSHDLEEFKRLFCVEND